VVDTTSIEKSPLNFLTKLSVITFFRQENQTRSRVWCARARKGAGGARVQAAKRLNSFLRRPSSSVYTTLPKHSFLTKQRAESALDLKNFRVVFYMRGEVRAQKLVESRQSAA
jgi:hypothetical protein